MFPKSVLEQAQYDAGIARKNDPNRNAFQRAQDFLRSKLTGKPNPSPSQRTPQQQVEFDAREAKRIQKQQNIKKVTKTGKVLKDTVVTGNPLKNTVVGGAVYAAGSALIPHISRETVRGAHVALGLDTTDYDNLNAGRPVVRNLGGVSYNIATPEGLKGYQAAQKSGAKDSTPPKQPPTPQAPESTSSTGRDEPRTSPTGVPQTGTRTGPTPMKMEDLQQYLGKDVQLANPFLSNGLPGTNDDGYSYGDAVAMGANPAEAATVKGGGEVEVTFEGGEQIETKMVQGSPNLVLSGTESAAPSDVKTNDINDPSTWDENYARRRAFLDADSSMAGLKAVQAQKGIVYAGDKYYMNTGKEDDKGNPVLNAIEGPDAKQDVRGYMRGAQGAEDLKNKYIDKITNETEEEEDNK